MYEIGSASAADRWRIGDWAAAEGWNPGRSDPLVFGSADPGGFLVGRLDGEPVGSVSAVRYGSGFGFVGLYLVRPEHRGYGYGFALWEAALDRLGGRLVGLDGVVEQQANYRRSGFAQAWNNIRYEGVPSAVDGGGVAVSDAKAVPHTLLAEYDSRFFPAPREAFLANWVGFPDRTARVVVEDGRVRGFAVKRDARGPSRVGPLFADTPRIAAALLADLSDANPLALDVPDANPEALRLAEAAGLTPVFEAARMYTGPAPDLPLSCLYGVTSLELG